MTSVSGITMALSPGFERRNLGVEYAVEDYQEEWLRVYDEILPKNLAENVPWVGNFLK
jgi:hypothetical protein